jgi:hydroxyacylglutathione hydrolase
MERGNLEGADAIAETPPPPLTAAALEDLHDEALVVDVRSPSAFLGAHLPKSLSLPEGMISAFAGWFLEPGDALVLVADDPAQAERSAKHLARIGYDDVRGFLGPNLPGWAAGGGDFNTVRVIDANAVAERLDAAPADWALLDVRGIDEVRDERIEPSTHVFLGNLPGELDDLDQDGAYTIMCGSGARATIAASLLLRAGFSRVDLFLGSLGAWKQEGLDTSDAA